MKYLIFGNGYIGNRFKNLLGDKAEISSTDIGNYEEIKKEIDKYIPKILINCAGKTGRPNIDWCEKHKEETRYSNVTGPINLAKIAKEKSLKMIHLGSGCVYYPNHTKEISESEKPEERLASYYSKTKIEAEKELSNYSVLQLRLRMPVDSIPDQRNLINKLISFKKVINTPNSITILPDLVDTAKQLINKNSTGIYNVVNPGGITHPEILELYKRYVDPNHKYDIFDLDKLNQLVSAKRSNCVLSTKKLENEGIILKSIHERLPEILKEYSKHV